MKRPTISADTPRPLEACESPASNPSNADDPGGSGTEAVSRRLNLSQLLAAKREGYKDGFHAGRRIASEQAYIEGYRNGLRAARAFETLLASR
nr:hypothetical protein HUO10_005175 [Paraburkholderia busanensis]